MAQTSAHMDQNLADDALSALINPSFKSDIPKIKRRVSAPVVAAQANKPGLGWRHNKAGQIQTLLNKISAFLGPAMTQVIWSCFKCDHTSDANCPCWCTKLCFCVCILPSVNWDDFNERVLPDLGQVQSGTPESPTSIFLLSQ